MPIVAAGIMAVGALSSLASSIFGGGAKRDAAYAAADLTNQQAGMTRSETEEQYKRSSLAITQASGAAQASAGASGFAYGSAPGTPQDSMGAYVTAFSAEMRREAAFARGIGLQKADLIDKSADVQRQAADAGLFGDIMGGAAGFLSGAGNAIKTIGG